MTTRLSSPVFPSTTQSTIWALLRSSSTTTAERADHIDRHNAHPHEVEEAAFDDPDHIVQVLKRADRDNRQKVYRLLGRTSEGRHLTFIFIYEGQGIAYPVTARDMTSAERRYYHNRT